MERGRRKAPRWTVSFLRALERTGEVRAAAEDAGIDYSTAYARRRAHADFGDAWDAAVYRYSVAKEQREGEEIAAVVASPPLPARASRESPTPAKGGAELVSTGSQVKRVGPGRWSQAREAVFFEELAASANVKRAAAAAGVSANAVYARRLKSPLFRAKWEAVRETAKAAIDMHLLEQSKRSFDHDALDTGEVTPRVSIDQAIKIAQSGASRSRRQDDPDPFEGAEEPGPMEEMRARLIKKINAMHKRAIVEKTALGWSYDESFDVLIPPGWLKGPDYKPKEPDTGPTFDELYQ
jgi:hypothetical protein